MRVRLPRRAAIAGAALLLAGCGPREAGGPGGAPPASPEPVRVACAASLGPVLAALAETFESETGIRVAREEGATSTLARQIEEGAPTEVFLAAGAEWMDRLEARGRVEPGTRRDVARGTLVIVAPRGRGFPFDPRGTEPLAGAFHGRLAIGDPAHVPVGMYAREALERAGWWAALEPRVVAAADARAALALVERGECAAGIVYATDARSSSKADLVAALPASLHDPVVYPGALVAGRAGPGARRFLDWLGSPGARDVLATWGFGTDPGATR